MLLVRFSMHPLLVRIPIFKNLSREDYELLEGSLESRSFAKGEQIYNAGENTSALFVVKTGMVKIYQIRKGITKEEIVEIYRKYDVFPLFELLTKENFATSAKALTDLETITISKEVIQKLLEQSHVFSLDVNKHFAARLCNLTASLCELSLSTTRERLARYIYREYEAQRKSRSLLLPLNQTQLASYLGTVRETVSRDLAALKKAKIISSMKSKVEILSLEDLRQMAGCN